MPLYKSGKWDGKIKLFDFIEKRLPIGLVDQLVEFLESKHIPYELKEFESDSYNISEEYLDKFIEKLKIPFPVRDYQKQLVLDAINRKKAIFVSATSSGKSLAIYILCMFMLFNKKKVFIIVPTVTLVHQMKSDFVSYGLDQEKADSLIHCIFSGQEKEFKKKICISTWQSCYKPAVIKEFTTKINGTDAQYDCIIVDEAHLLKAAEGKKLCDIVEAFSHSPWKIGVTGSLPRNDLDKQQIIASMGTAIQIIEASELVDRGLATKLEVNVVFLKHKDETIKKVNSVRDWQKEAKILNENPDKFKFIAKLVNSKFKKGNNIIVFFRRIQYGKALYKFFQEYLGKENVLYVDGGVNGVIRDDIRKEIELANGKLLIASFGTFSTGINIKKLHCGICSENIGKSDTVLIQSLGRFLRLHADKDSASFYDLVDDCREYTKNNKEKKSNYSYKHFRERLEIYREQGWDLKEVIYEL